MKGTDPRAARASLSERSRGTRAAQAEHEQPATPKPSAVSRPTFFDYLFLLGGMGLSLYLMRLAPIRREPDSTVTEPHLAGLITFLPELMRFPEGIILLWPMFFALQWPGRSESLTAGEWLWLFAWVGVALLTAMTAWDHLGGLPSALQPHAAKPRVLWYVIVMPAMGALALLVLLASLFGRLRPWTHNLGLALVLWPAIPALTVLALGRLSTP